MGNQKSEVLIPINGVCLQGTLSLPESTKALVVFSHGSGSSRFSPRNRFVAHFLNDKGIGTLLIDLLSPEEDEVYENRFDIDLLTHRLIAVTRHMHQHPAYKNLKIGLFGASTGAASALRTASVLPQVVDAVVSRGGRPDLATSALPMVQAPTLLIVGGLDVPVIDMNRAAYDLMTCPREMVVVEGASHLFEEPGKLEEVARLAADWFTLHLSKKE